MLRNFFKINLIFILFSIFLSCEEYEQEKKEDVFRSYTGEVEVLNSCGQSGAAFLMRDFLRKNGFDVVSYGNSRLQNFQETVLVVHTFDWEGVKPLAKVLETDNILYIKNKHAYVDVTVYVGKNFQEIITQDSL